jgi:putative ATP-binding cassette transporter
MEDHGPERRMSDAIPEHRPGRPGPPGTRAGAWIGSTARIVRFLFVEGGVLGDPVVVFALLASLGRTGLILAINETARAAPGDLWQPVLLILAAVVYLVASYFSRLRSHLIVVRLQARLRRQFCALVLAADVDFLQGGDHGTVYSATTREVSEVSGAAVNLIEAVEAVVLVCFCIPYLFWISWTAGLATLGALAIGTTAFIVFEQPARRYLGQAARASAEFHDRVEDMLSGWKEVRLRRSRREALAADTLRVIAAEADDTLRAERLFSASTIGSQAAIIFLLCVLVAPIPFLDGGSAPFQVLTVILLTYGPIEMLFASLPRLSRAEAGRAKLAEVGAALRAAGAGAEVLPEVGTAPDVARIELQAVTARLHEAGADPAEERGFHLGPVDLTLRRGEVVFISGGNGSGKSTLVDIIAGLRRPDGGRVLWDGTEVTEAVEAEYRALFSSVFSRFHLFEKTYGLSAEELGLLARALDELDLSHRVRMDEDRFSTLALSSGQRRRLALAVAVAENRPVILFDEFAADQDPYFRAYFYDTLLPRLAARGHLVIAVTHDDSQFAKCDRLIRMEAGRIVGISRPDPAAAAP